MVVGTRSLLPLLLLTASAFPAQAEAPVSGPVAAAVERVIDGDTVRVRARIWVDQTVEVSVRVRGVDAPELFRPRCENERAQARAAKDFAEALLAGGAVLLHDIEHDKYGGRVVARILAANGEDLGAALIREGFAVAIGADRGWCS